MPKAYVFKDYGGPETQSFLDLPKPARGPGQFLAVRAAKPRVAVPRRALGVRRLPLADILDPPVTVVAQDVAALGRVAAELLFARLDGDSTPAPHVVVPT